MKKNQTKSYRERNKMISFCLRRFVVICSVCCCVTLGGLLNAQVAAAATFSVSGTLYSDAGSTIIETAKTVSIAIGTSTVSVHSTTSENGTGDFSFVIDNSNGLAVDDSFVVWINGDASNYASVVSKFSSTTEDVVGLDLYKDRVIVRQEGATSTGVADFATYDSTADSDITFTASTTKDSLEITGNAELYIWSGDTFVNAASSTFTGSFHNDGGVFDHNDGRAKFTGTAQTLSGTLTGTSTLGKVSITGSYTASAIASTSDLTIASGGSFTAPSLLTVDGVYANYGTFTHNSGRVYLMGSDSFSLANPEFFDSLAIAGQESGPSGLVFSDDGLKLFVIGYSGDDVSEYTLSTAFDVSSRTYIDSFSIAAQETNPQALAFSATGDKLFITGQDSDSVHEYTLSTAFDISTASFVDSFSIVAKESGPTGLAFSADGYKMFAVGAASDNVHEYTLSTAFDISTASFVDSFSVSAYTSAPADLAFSTDGYEMFVLDSANKRVLEYTLSTAFDVSTAVFTRSFSVSAQENSSSGLTFSSDGTKMYLTGNDGDSIYSFYLNATHVGNLVGASAFHDLVIADKSQFFDVYASTSDLTISSGATLTPSSSLSVSGDYVNEGLFRSNRGTVYLTGSGKSISGNLTETSSFYGLTVVGSYTASDNASTTNLEIAASGEFTAPTLLGIDGDYVNNGTFNAGSGTVFLESDGFDIDDAYFAQSYSVAGQETSPHSAAFSNDGYKMFILGFAGKDVNEYTLSTAFDISTASFVDSFSVSAQETFPLGLAFSNDGYKMFVVGNSADAVNEYTLSTAFDVSTASFVDAFSVAAQETDPQSVAFSNDGYKMFVAGSAGDDVNEYTLSTAFDVSTASFVDFFPVFVQDSQVRDVHFSADGYKMFVVGGVGRDINVYTLETSFDVSTAAYRNTQSFADKDSLPKDVLFSADGTQMYIMGDDSNTIYQFLLDDHQTFSGVMTGSSAFHDVESNGDLIHTFSSNASTSDFTITTSSATVTLPTLLSISGTYTNNGRVDANNSIIYLTGTSKSIAGTLTGTKSLSNVIVTGSYTASANASTSDLTIVSGGSFTAPSLLTIAGDLSQQGSFDSNSGVIYFTGVNPKVAGNLVGSNRLHTVVVENQAPGDVWTVQSAAGNDDGWEGVVHGAGTFVSVSGSGDRVMYSNDGISWTSVTAAGDNDWWRDVAYGDGLFVAVSNSGDTRVMTSPDGINWTARSAVGNDDQWFGVTYGDGLFVAVGYGGDRVMTSPDGINWTARSAAGDNDQWRSVTYGNSLFVAVGDSGDRVMTSPDGINWTARSAAGDNDNWWDVTYGNSLFVAVSSYSSDVVMTSPDGINWTARSAAGDNDYWGGVSYGAGLYVAAAWAGDTRFMTSPDGTTWTTITVAGNNDGWYDATYGAGTFVVVGNSGDRVVRSASGLRLGVASTSDVVIGVDKVLVSTTTLTVLGDYTNNGVFSSGFGEVVFGGTTQQTATGTLLGDSAFYDLTITNTSANGTTTQSVVFGMPVSVTGTYTMVASTSARFLAGATSTFQNVDWQGGEGSPVWLRSSNQGEQWYLDVPGSQLTVSYVDVQDSDASASASTVVASDSIDSGNNSNWNFAVAVTGSSTVSDHDATQVSNAFSFQNITDGALFAFKLTPESGNATVTDLTVSLSGVKKVVVGDFSNFRLFRDHDNDALYSVGDEQVGGVGVMDITGDNGSIAFTSDFLATTSQNYLVVADWNTPENGSFMNLDLYPSGIVTIDAVGAQEVYGDVNRVQHYRDNQGGSSGASVVLGGGDVQGRSVETGGTAESGEVIGNDPNYKRPTSQTGDWVDGANAYDQTDGTYASTAVTNASSSYTKHGFGVPGGNTVTGVEIKLEVSGTTASGDISVQLSWNGGASWTTSKTTPTLTTADKVVTLGGASDLWGRSWSGAEFTNANFAVRLIGGPSSNTVRVDAIQVRVYHYKGGGSVGGGGAI